MKQIQQLSKMPQYANSSSKYLNFSKLSAFLLVHFGHLGFDIRVVPHQVKVALIVI